MLALASAFSVWVNSHFKESILDKLFNKVAKYSPSWWATWAVGGNFLDKVQSPMAKMESEASPRTFNGPDKNTVWDLFGSDSAVGFLDLSSDHLGVHLLDGGLQLQVDLGFGKDVLGVLDQLLVEHVQDVRHGFNEGNLDVNSGLWVPLLQVLVNEILQFSGKLNTGWTTTNNDKVQKSLSLWVVLCTDSEHQVVVVQVLAHGIGALDGDGLLDWVNVGGFGFKVQNLTGTSSGDGSDWFDDGLQGDGTGRSRWEQWSEKEVVSWRDNNNVELGGVHVLQHGHCTPTGTQNDQVLLRSTVWQSSGLWLLLGWVGLFVDGVGNVGSSS
ncbi:hypothetical protein WICPIJ_008467 [Wickerhamomyces pijperi]|uniref:Uncharacterized protein n=1 Tax=Wickerhamomyces pijperi TaxID=599730 RepID=A0A9P8PX70_WICPI|nr:hypothetical protein WICPIJ_008467 [Wickerhamomyces pijperi]